MKLMFHCFVEKIIHMREQFDFFSLLNEYLYALKMITFFRNHKSSIWQLLNKIFKYLFSNLKRLIHYFRNIFQNVQYCAVRIFLFLNLEELSEESFIRWHTLFISIIHYKASGGDMLYILSENKGFMKVMGNENWKKIYHWTLFICSK